MKKFNYLLTLVMMISLFACGKYEEGPSISLRSKKGRLANDWKINEKYINGEKIAIDEEEKDITFTIEKDGKGAYSANGASVPFVWEFEDGKESIKVTSSFQGTTPYKILKLENDELWLESTEDGDKIQDRYVSK